MRVMPRSFACPRAIVALERPRPTTGRERWGPILLFLVLLAGVVPLATPSRAVGQAADEVELFGDVGMESRLFVREPLLVSQPRWLDLSIHARLEAEWILRDDLAFRGMVFGRFDPGPGDPRRTHADVREAYVQVGDGPLVAEVGMNVVFWGVTESRHLVDVVNQTDYLEDLDGEEKLGQLMARLSYDHLTLGLVEAFVMTWSRPVRFPGTRDRPGMPVPLLYREERHGPGADVWDPDLALRWSHAVGGIDWALTGFRGTSREPELVPVVVEGRPAIRPSYELIRQAGLELQWTRENWLWKVEGLYRDGPGDPFLATTFGFERTFWGALGTADVGVLLEYSHDGRDDLTFTVHDEDLFGGVRVTLNDVEGTEILAGALTDVEDGAVFGSVEASRRIGAMLTLDLTGRLFVAGDPGDPLHWFRRDDHLEASVAYHF